MTPHLYVVLADRVRGFDTLDDAKRFAETNVPSVVCERRRAPDGSSKLVELFRHDWLFDRQRGEWRFMIG